MTLGTVREMPVVLEDGLLINVWINESFKVTDYFVNYKKLQAVGAEIGGIVSFCIGLSLFILNPLLRIDFISKFIS
jgi:hypothetical protein